MNAVGVDLNTASAPLLARVSGIGASARQEDRRPSRRQGRVQEAQGAARRCRGSGRKRSSNAAGFLRIPDGDEPLDASSRASRGLWWCRRSSAACGRDIKKLIGNAPSLEGLHPKPFVDETFGLPTVRRHPRGNWKSPAAIRAPNSRPRPSGRRREIRDLKPGMVLEGTVTNVAAFGAFVDIGVHQDGLVHVSQVEDLRQRPARSGEAGRHRAREGDGGGCRAQAHLAHACGSTIRWAPATAARRHAARANAAEKDERRAEGREAGGRRRRVRGRLPKAG